MACAAEGSPPRQVPDSRLILRFVSIQPEAIGYVPATLEGISAVKVAARVRPDGVAPP